MKKSKRAISLLLSVLMLVSVFQVGFVAFAADGTNNGAALSATEAAILPDAGAVTTSSEVVRVASGFYSYEIGTTIVPATESGIPAMNGSFEENSLANTDSINETASYPYVKITFDELPSDVPQIKCVNTDSSTAKIVMSSAIDNEAEKSYTWFISSGTAKAGDTLRYEISYTYNSEKYVSYAYSYVENIAQPAGSYVSTEYTDTFGSLGLIVEGEAGVSAVTRVLGKNTYSSLGSFTTSSSDLRGYYNASSNNFVVRSTADYSTYNLTRTDEDTDSTHTFLLNDRRSYADVYVDTSAIDSFADLNLRYAVTKPEDRGGNSTQDLELVGVIKGYEDVSINCSGTGDLELGTNASVGTMVAVGKGTSQYVTTFTGETFTDGTEYTLVTKISSVDGSTRNTTVFPVGIRIHATDKGELRALINDILHNNTPETPLVAANNKGVNPQSWYYSSGFEAYQAAMLDAQTVLTNPRSSQTEINNAVSSLANAYSKLVLNEAVYTGVEEAIAAANKYEEIKGNYTDSSYAKLQQAVSIYDAETNADGTIQYGYSILFQPQVDKWESDIYSAIESLEYRLADYTELDEAWARAEEAKANKDMYLDFSNVQAAMNNVDRTIIIIEQDKVDAMTEALVEALNNLKFRPADYTAVNDAVTHAQSYAASNYTTESYTALRTLLRSIDYTLTVDKQDEVDNYVTQINEAIANLDELPADYSDLEALLTHVDNLVEEYYTPETYAAAKAAAAACEGYESIGIINQAKVDKMADDLKAEIDKLVMYDADYSAVDDAIARFRAMDLKDITADSIAIVEEAISAVKEGLKIDQQSVVNEYAFDIENAISALQYKPADYSAITKAVAKAEALERSRYTSESLSVLDAAVIAANKAIENGYGIDRQTEVNELAAAVQDAIEQLQFGPADYSRVEAAIAEYEALNQNHYTPETWNDLLEAVDNVDWTLTNEFQAAVYLYALDISDAIRKLEVAEADYSQLYKILETVPDESALKDYTDESVAALNAVLDNYPSDLKAPDQGKIVEYQLALSKAIEDLKYRVGNYSDVDAAIAEGRDIIKKNDPPISQESIDAFEEYVASIDRTLTIKQEAEIAALASEIRSMYRAFTYAEGKYKASISLLSDRSVSYLGDTVTVSVVLGTDYYAATSSIPVVYDSSVYTLEGIDFNGAEGSYVAISETSMVTTSPAKGYPSSYTAADRATWKYVLVTISPYSSKDNSIAQILNPAQTVVDIQFKVNDDAFDTEAATSAIGKIWIDPAFQKTEDYKNGKLYIGRYESEVIDTNVITYGQTIDLSNAVLNLSIVDPNSDADFTRLKAAINQVLPYDAANYTEDTYKAYTDAIAVGQEVKSHEGEYTVMQQHIIDSATLAINEAVAALKLKPATTTALEEALELKPEYNSDVYTEDTFNAYVRAIQEGEELLERKDELTILNDAEIMALADKITKAHAALKLKDFSYIAEMNAALNKKTYDKSWYESTSYSAYEAAKTALENFKKNNPTILNDNEGLNLIDKLNDAYAALYLLDADTSELVAAINKPLDYPVNFYTPETYAEYQAAIDAGNTLLNREERLTVADADLIKQAVNNIEDAIEALEFMPYTMAEEVEKALDEIWPEDDDFDDIYTEESVEAFIDAYDELFDFLDYTEENDVDIRDDAEAARLIKALQDAFNNLKGHPADTSLLEDALALVPYDKSYYTDESYKAYEDAIAALKAYGEDKYWEKSEEELLNSLAQDIIDAFGELEYLPFTMLDELEAAIAVTPEYDKSFYQTDAYSEYEKALKDITDMIANDSLTKLDDPAAEEAIIKYNEALEALKTSIVDADYSDVELAISEAEALNRDNYTNFEIVDEAINAVVEGLDKTQQSTVDGYAKAIRDAIKNLDPKAGDYTVVEEAQKNYADKLAQMKADAPGIEINQSTIDAVEEAIAAVIEGLDITHQTEIDGFATVINAAVEELDYASTIVLKAISDAYITDVGYLRGLRDVGSEYSVTSNFDVYGRNTRIVVTRDDELFGYGTGLRVQHYDGDEFIKEYILVVDGDLDGSGYVDSTDVAHAKALINECLEPEFEYQKIAADLCEDGYLDAIDATILISIANFDFY